MKNLINQSLNGLQKTIDKLLGGESLSSLYLKLFKDINQLGQPSPLRIKKESLINSLIELLLISSLLEINLEEELKTVISKLVLKKLPELEKESEIVETRKERAKKEKKREGE